MAGTTSRREEAPMQNETGSVERGTAPAVAQPERPWTQTERTIARIWKEVLDRHDDVGGDADFFDLGGTSLDLIRVFIQVNQTFGLTLDGSVLGDEATIARIAECVDARRHG